MMNIHPNSSGNQTAIQFTLSQSSQVRLGAYDVDGKEITTLLNSMMEQGSHTVQLNLSSFSKAVYNVKMITVERTESQKLLVQ